MEDGKVTRRDFVRKGTAAGLAGAVAGAASADSQAADTASPVDERVLPGGMPFGVIGDLKISRLILGSNVPGAHSRDLIYVTAMGRAYNTPERMLDTFELAESQGINTILQGNAKLIRQYNETRGGRLRTIQPVGISKHDDKDAIRSILTSAKKNDLAAAFYIMGDRGDYLARDKKMGVAGTAMEVARELGILLGIGGHSLEVPIQCEKLGIKPDFYVKTFHDDNYWSATPKENREPFCWYNDAGGNSYSGKTNDHNRFHDNIWCLDAEKTTEVMSKVEAPWIAFKVLAAGAIHPRHGFRFAFENGADFIAVGMLDIQIRANVARTKQCVRVSKDRDRPWRA